MKINYWWIGLVVVFAMSCQNENYVPKPLGYARIDFPEHSYQTLDSEFCPFNFEYSKFAKIVPVKAVEGQRCWFNIAYPNQKATIHFSYLDIKPKLLGGIIEDSRKLAMEHLRKADDYEESVVLDTSANVYGVIYDFSGSTASNYQFYLTDSVNYFIRGALYFEVTPKADSLSPAEKYIEEDVYHLIQSFTWVQD
jgi:gliding motility-associated lipoprotein GldD